MTQRKILLRKINEAFAKNNSAFIIENISDDIEWTVHGDFMIKGKEAFTKKLQNMVSDEEFQLEIDNIITHGKEASVNGTMKSPNKEVYAFCDIYSFSGFKKARIRKITSYVIKI